KPQTGGGSLNYSYEPEAQIVSYCVTAPSECCQTLHRANNVFGLRQNLVFELRLISAERVRCCNAANGCIQILEQFVGNPRGNLRAVTPGKRVLINNDDAISFLYGSGNRIPIIRTESPQIQNFGINSLPAELGCSHLRAMNYSTISDDAHIFAFANEPRFAKRNCEIRAGISATVVRLTIQMLVFEEHHRVVATNCRAQQTTEIQSRGGHYHAQARLVSEEHFAALAVVNRASGQISAYSYANDRRTFEIPSGAPAHCGQFVANLHHGRPDVVEKLNFGHWLHAPRGHTNGAANDVRLRQWRVKGPFAAIATLQAGGSLKHAAFAFDLAETFLAAAIGDVFAEDDDALVASHFIHQIRGDHFHHRQRLAGLVHLGSEFFARRINVGRIDKFIGRIRLRQSGCERLVSGR